MSTKYSAPQFLTPLRDLTVNEGEKAHFDAKVGPVGDPSMKVEWFFNGQLITASKYTWFWPIVFDWNINTHPNYACVNWL